MKYLWNKYCISYSDSPTLVSFVTVWALLMVAGRFVEPSIPGVLLMTAGAAVTFYALRVLVLENLISRIMENTGATREEVWEKIKKAKK